MHHQVQQFGDLGLERLGLGCRRGIGGHTSRFPGLSGSGKSGKPGYSDTILAGKFQSIPQRAVASVATLPDYQ
jgi:hypothetical protein